MGGALFSKKVDDLFLVVALKDRLNIPPNLSHQAKTVLTSSSAIAERPRCGGVSFGKNIGLSAKIVHLISL